MKLLSRFIWLIVGISIVVLASISIVNLRANREFQKIRNSISDEYSTLIEKALEPEKSEINTYCYDISNASGTQLFLDLPYPDQSLIEIFLDTMVLNLFKVDGLWFYGADGNLFHFYTHRYINPENLILNYENISGIMKDANKSNFFIRENDIVFRVFATRVGTPTNTKGYIFAATEFDYSWISQLENEINNSKITLEWPDKVLEPITKDVIRIESELLSYNKSTIAILKTELRLPFLKLWHSTTSTDRWLITIALIIMLVSLVYFLTQWVVSPLKRISSSLKNEESKEILPLLKSKTEMGDVARMIGDYYFKKEALESSESIKRHIIEHAQVGIIIIDSETHQIINANPFACQLIGAPEDAISGSLCVNFLCPHDNVKDCPLHTLDEIENQESTLFNAFGEKIPILRTVNKIYMGGKQVFMETFVDLSQIKSLQSKLEDEKLKLSMAMQNSGLVFCEYDFTNDQITLPEDWRFITNGNSTSIGKNIIENIYPSDVKNVTEQIKQLSSDNRDTLVSEFRIKHPTRGLIWISLSILITKRDEKNYPKQLIGLFENITDRINIQQELIKAKEKAEESDRLKTSYLANMSHKIRTPMNAIVGFANLLNEEDFSQEEKATYVKIISRDTEQLLHLIDDIINMARLDAEQLEVIKKPVSLNGIIGELSSYFKANEKTEKIKFEIKTMLADGKDVIITDDVKLKVIMNSLLNNAFKFTSKGTIELGYFVNPATNKLILYVKDSGIGIKEESKNKIFDRFYQEDTRSDGTGLGLTISQGLVKLLNGNLTFESREGEGSSFYIELPMEKA
jgi:PAS domain S-box-containing protein